jgi:hypothetical protein
MNERRITPQRLAKAIGFSRTDVERGLKGEPVPIRHALPTVIVALGLIDAREKGPENIADVLTYDKCLELLKPPPAMPPRQGNFWEYEDDSDV